MSQQQSAKDILQPLYPIPIITAPQPLVPTTNKLAQLNPKDELEVYKREYHRLVKENNLLLAHLNKVTEDKEALEAKYNNMHVQKSSLEEKRKRVRRTAGQIVREYNCYLQKCGKSYGTEASLAQHIKLKHPEAYSSKQYEEHIGNLRKKMGVKTNLIIQGCQLSQGISKENNLNLNRQQ